ncbi:hypothetical protein M3573_19395 [Bacillus safensis]|uniref:hypothetical protein n=1 Tax=Bacillus safensis TaxID=561879 RepID=UPI002041BA62|nr:hypothetical protein [Bacillus safensis]MCM3140446.1 hypothetical protein [Bacillus safensis]
MINSNENVKKMSNDLKKIIEVGTDEIIRNYKLNVNEVSNAGGETIDRISKDLTKMIDSYFSSLPESLYQEIISVELFSSLRKDRKND